MTTPDWLRRHDGSLRSGMNGNTIFVLIGGEPEYRLTARPAEGKFTCEILQTVNSGRIDSGKEYATISETMSGGLEELRAKLGW
jgi:hypothetical protein